jgi:phosphohistidine phosphatase
MALYVVQHGNALPKTEDPEKGLSAEGKAETLRIAQVAKSYSVSVSEIRHSGKKRARETAEILAAALTPEKGVFAIHGLNPLDDVSVFGAGIDLSHDIMLVGHLPFLERLIGLLVCDDSDRTVFKLQNSGILCIDRVDGIRHPVIRWGLMPSVG